MKRITFFILSILCFTACNDIANDIRIEDDAPQIQLVMPDATEVKVYSTATESECRIGEIWVYVFDKATGNYVHHEQIDGADIVVSTRNQAVQLLPQLKPNPMPSSTSSFLDGKIIVCVANSGKPNPGTINRSAIDAAFSLTTTTSFSGGDLLPMYGWFEFTANGNFTCEMERVVAKVQVQMGTSVSDVTGSFDAETVTYSIRNVQNSGRVASTPSSGTTNTPDFSLVQKNNATQSQTHAYVYETMSSAPNTTFAANRHHILLRAGASSYYRLDFYNPIDSTFFDIERNHHYLFTINKIRSAGYASPTEAQKFPGGNIEYTVRVDGSGYATSNGQYAIATVDTVFVPVPGSVSITAKAIFPSEMGTISTPADFPAPNTITATPATLMSATSFAVGDLSAGKSITITAPAGFTSGTITFRLGNITHVLPVRAQ